MKDLSPLYKAIGPLGHPSRRPALDYSQRLPKNDRRHCRLKTGMVEGLTIRTCD
jgi:hypothetical protein